MLRGRKAQSVLEYVVMFTAIIAAVLLFVQTMKTNESSASYGLGKVFSESTKNWTTSAEELKTVVNP